MVIVNGICFCFSGTSSPHNDSYSHQLMIWLRAHWHYCLKFIYVDELEQGFHLHHKAHCRWLEKLIQSPFGWFTNNCTDTLCSMTDYEIISKFCLNIMQISACYFMLIPLKQKFTTDNRNWLFVDARQVTTTGVGLFENQKSVLIQEKSTWLCPPLD